MIAIDPGTTALVLIDLQRCFLDERSEFAPRGGDHLVKRLNALACRSRDAGMLVIFTAHVVRPDHSNAGSLPEIVPAVATGMIDETSEEASLRADLQIRPGDLIVSKPRFSAFAGTDLSLILRTRGIRTVVIGGVATDVCCESTARDASDRGLDVVFLSDGTATTDDRSQQSALDRIRLYFGHVHSIAEVEGGLESDRPAHRRQATERPRPAKA